METLIDRLKVIVDEIGTEKVSGQTALSKAAGASKSVVNQWLSGKIKSIDIRFALEIEKNLGYNHIWFMTGTGEKKVNPQTGVVYVDRVVEKPENKLLSMVYLGLISDEEAALLEGFRVASSGPRGIMLGVAKGALAHQAKVGSDGVVDDEGEVPLSGTL